MAAGADARGQVLFLLGETRDELDGSEWARVVHGHLGGRPPAVDLAAERRLGEVVRAAAADGLLSATHDLSEGGLAQALVELCLINGIGAVIDLPAGADPFVAFFSESTARMVVAVPAADADRFTALCDQHGQASARLGAFTPDAGALDITGVARVGFDDLRTAWEGTLPALFG